MAELDNPYELDNPSEYILPLLYAWNVIAFPLSPVFPKIAICNIVVPSASEINHSLFILSEFATPLQSPFIKAAKIPCDNCNEFITIRPVTKEFSPKLALLKLHPDGTGCVLYITIYIINCYTFYLILNYNCFYINRIINITYTRG